MSKSIDQELTDAQVALENVIKNKKMLKKLAVVGYDMPKIKVGKAKCEKAMLLQSLQKKEYGLQYDATKALHQAQEEAEEVFSKHVSMARIVFKKNRNAIKSLQLSGLRKRNFAAWQERARIFYTNAPEWVAELEPHGISLAELERGKAMTEAVLAAFGQRRQDKGKAQQSTRKRDAALAELKAWMKDFLAIARVALQDDEEHMEAVGLTVR